MPTYLTPVKHIVKQVSVLLFKIMQCCNDNIYYIALNSFDLDDCILYIYKQLSQFQTFYDQKHNKICCCGRRV